MSGASSGTANTFALPLKSEFLTAQRDKMLKIKPLLFLFFSVFLESGFYHLSLLSPSLFNSRACIVLLDCGADIKTFTRDCSVI